MERKNIWVNEGHHIAPYEVVQALPIILNYDGRCIISHLKPIKQLQTGIQPGICVIEVLSPDEPQGWNEEFIGAETKGFIALSSGVFS